MNPQKALFALLTLVLCMSATAEEQWTWTLRRSGPEHLNAVAAGNGMFVAGGDSGTIITSGDGVEWTVRHSGWKHPASTIVWGGGKYLAYTRNWSPRNEYNILTSNDGIVWDDVLGTCNRCNLLAPNFESVAYGNGIFVTYGNWSDTFISPDGVQWQGDQRPNLIAFDNFGMPMPLGFSSIIYGNGTFLLSGADLCVLAMSGDGTIWEILYGGISPNGSNCGWPYYRMMYDGNRFVVTSGNNTYFTNDLKSFEMVSTNSVNLAPMAYNGSIYVAINGTEIGVLSQGTVPIINSGRFAKPASGFIMRQNGRVLKIAMPNQEAYPLITLFNVAGKRQRVEQAYSGDGSISISLSNLAAGSYILRVNDGKNSWQRRIMVR